MAGPSQASTVPRVLAVKSRLQHRRALALVTMGLALLGIVALALMLGDYPVTPEQVVASLLSPFSGAAQPGVDFVILGLRLPRALLAVVAGASFGISGTVFQTLLRNPLASPDIVGISSGASAAAVAGIVLFGWSGLALSVVALGGAVLTASAIYLLGWRGGISPYRIVLIGIGMAAILGAVISYLFTRARIETARQAMAWLVGSINGATLSQSVPVILALCVFGGAILLLRRGLGGLELGDDTAGALGVPVETVRLVLLFAAVGLAAFATAAVGPIAFVAFVSGPIARILLGPAGTSVVAGGLVGAVVVLGADLIAQNLLSTQMPVGVVTGAFGALFLLALLATANRVGRAG